MTSHTPRTTSPRSSPPSWADLAIFLVGLIAAAASGVIAYRLVGPYGDGFLNMGLYRMRDPDTGHDVIYREVRQADGSVTRYMAADFGQPFHTIRATGQRGGQQVTVDVHAEEGRMTGFTLETDADGDGLADLRDYFDATQHLVKQGFALGGAGPINAWQYRDATGAVVRIEISRSQTGQVDRWEHYEAGQLTRAEEDDDRDGRPDHWLTYEDGILTHEARDRDHDGRPDTRP